MAYTLNMKTMKIRIGSEVNVNGKWAVVDEITDGVAFCLDQDGGTIEIDVKNIDTITRY